MVLGKKLLHAAPVVVTGSRNPRLSHPPVTTNNSDPCPQGGDHNDQLWSGKLRCTKCGRTWKPNI